MFHIADFGDRFVAEARFQHQAQSRTQFFVIVCQQDFFHVDSL